MCPKSYLLVAIFTLIHYSFILCLLLYISSYYYEKKIYMSCVNILLNIGLECWEFENIGLEWTKNLNIKTNKCCVLRLDFEYMFYIVINFNVLVSYEYIEKSFPYKINALGVWLYKFFYSLGVWLYNFFWDTMAIIDLSFSYYDLSLISLLYLVNNLSVYNAIYRVLQFEYWIL